MRRAFVIFSVGLASLFSALHAEDFDGEADAQILACVHSTELSQVQIDYPFGVYIYPIWIIHNPLKERLWAEGFSAPQTWPLAMMGNLPFELIGHLRDLIPELNTYREDCYIDLRGYQEISPELFEALEPITTYTQIDDPAADAEIKELFSSSEFVNQVFHYRLESGDYKVRILHNPEKQTLSTVRQYQLEVGESWRKIPLNWVDRYGIIVDRKAPQELIDHLSLLASASTWNWYFNFTAENGTHVTFFRYRYGVNTTYYLDTWFDYTSDLE